MMGFRLILRKTFLELSNPFRTLALLAVGILAPVLASLAWGPSLEQASLQAQSAYAAGNFFSISFIWTAGLFLALAVSVPAAGFVCKEYTDGTLSLLVSRPISRWQIVIAKVSALVVYSMLLEALVLLLSAVVIWLWLGLEIDVLNALVRSALWTLPYALLVILVFGSVSAALSTYFRSTVRSTLVATMLIVFVFLFSLIGNTLFPKTYDGRQLSVIDPGAHLRNVFVSIVEASQRQDIVPEYYGPLLSFTGLKLEMQPVSYVGYGDFLYRKTQGHPEPVKGPGAASSLAIWLAVALGSLGLSAAGISRKEA